MTLIVPLEDRSQEFERLFEFIQNGLVAIRLKWRIYRAMFGTNAERVELMNSISGTTALVIQDAIYDDVILSLGRLADPARSAGKDNNSVARLHSLAAIHEGADKLRILQELLSNACEPLRTQRNRFIAHSDMEAHFGTSGPNGVSRLQIEAAIEALRDVVVFVGKWAYGTDILSEVHSAPKTDEVQFLRALYYGRMKMEEEMSDIMALLAKPADPRKSPPERWRLKTFFSKPEWLNYRPPEKGD